MKISNTFSNIIATSYIDLNDEEKIGYFKRKSSSAVLEDFWKSKEFLDFLNKVTGIDSKFSRGDSWRRAKT